MIHCLKALTMIMLFGLMPPALSAQKYSTANAKAVKQYEKAVSELNAREHDKALKSLGAALKAEPKFIEAHLLTFEVYSELGKLPEARESLLDATGINADFFPNAWFFLAALEFRMGMYRDALTHIDKFTGYRQVNPEMRDYALTIRESCSFAMAAKANPVPFKPINLGNGVNTPMPEYFPTVTADGATLLFTRKVDDPLAFRGKNEDFYISQYQGGAWSEALPFRQINSAYNEGAATLSADGRTLIFTSCEVMGEYGAGRTGYGSCDLFISRKEGSQWSAPQNLGAPVNSRNWETQPSLSADGKTLYFIRGRSTKEGVKDQDIYVTYLTEIGTWTKPEALGNAINTPGKEESVMIHPDGRTLYFASDGHVGMGGTDLYMSRMDKTGAWEKPVNLGYPINTHEDENSILVGPDGRVAFFASDRQGGFGALDLYSFELPDYARPTPITYARGLVTDARTGQPIGSELYMVDVDDAQYAFNFESDAQNGEFLIALPLGRTYALSIKKPGYLFYSETFELQAGDPGSPYQIHARLSKPGAGERVILKNIFFDLDKDVLKPQSESELNELYQFLTNNAGVRIEIGGHTDNQGSDAYNLDLSGRRALAVKQYLVHQKGIDAMRIEVKGYGASKPIATNDTEEGRALNRRTEFTILSAK